MYGSIGFTRRKTRIEKPLTDEQQKRLIELRKQIDSLNKMFHELPDTARDEEYDNIENDIKALEMQIDDIFAK